MPQMLQPPVGHALVKQMRRIDIVSLHNHPMAPVAFHTVHPGKFLTVNSQRQARIANALDSAELV
jgi:hypothetical protein